MTRRTYRGATALDIHLRLRQLDVQQGKLREGNDYLKGRLADDEHPEWERHAESWQLFRRANKLLVAAIEEQRKALHAELTARAEEKLLRRMEAA